MGFFEVTSREIRSKAAALGELNGQFKGKENELENKEVELTSMWEGEAKSAFHMAFSRDKSQMDAFSSLIEQYVSALLEIAQRYEEAERRAAELAASRSY
ncbi:MAG: WXG100 family type VII secretion target [Lachnospiraceae bacterium]|nr:WXG100 family type VII secretion target [Lachnospiraceae bacterium]